MAIIFGVVRAGGLLSSLGRITRVLPGSVEKADKEAAEQVAEQGQQEAEALGGVHAHVADGVMQVGSTVSLDANGHPAILGAEFGGGARPATRQFPPWTNEGYMVYPILHDDDLLEAYEESLGGDLLD